MSYEVAALALRGGIAYACRSEVMAMVARALGCLAFAIPLTVAGCDPVISIAGANFPDWLLCVGAGAILAALCHPLLVAARLERELRPLALFYGGLIAMFALIGWVSFFSRA